MFPSSRTSTPTQRALGALRLARSFLLLEDDDDVDWEVDREEPAQAEHPHRVPLRGRAFPRRQGSTGPREQVCLSPVGSRGAGEVATNSLAGGSERRATFTRVGVSG